MPGDADLLCIRCRYNLRTLTDDRACPECGLPIRDTLAAVSQYPDARWLRTLRLGLDCALASLALGVVTVVAVGIVESVTNSTATIIPAAILMLLGPPAFALMGAWLFSTPEPGHDAPDARRIARLCAVALVAIWVVSLLGALPNAQLEKGHTVLFTVAVATACVGVVTAGAWSREVALRLNRPVLARLTWFVARADAAVGCAALIGIGMLVFLSIANPNESVVMVVLTIGVIGFLATLAAFLLFGLATVALMIAFRVTLAATLRHASSRPHAGPEKPAPFRGAAGEGPGASEVVGGGG